MNNLFLFSFKTHKVTHISVNIPEYMYSNKCMYIIMIFKF